jgi:hypothetical protein
LAPSLRFRAIVPASRKRDQKFPDARPDKQGSATAAPTSGANVGLSTSHRPIESISPLLWRAGITESLIKHMREIELIATARSNVAATIGCLQLPPLLDVRPIEQLLVENRHNNDQSSWGATDAYSMRTNQHTF